MTLTREVHDGVVDQETSARRSILESVHFAGVAAEDVECQGLLSGISAVFDRAFLGKGRRANAHRSLMKAIASSGFFTVITGRIGPKI